MFCNIQLFDTFLCFPLIALIAPLGDQVVFQMWSKTRLIKILPDKLKKIYDQSSNLIPITISVQSEILLILSEDLSFLEIKKKI